jgi:FtsZ-binding cell division protein ZapB
MQLKASAEEVIKLKEMVRKLQQKYSEARDELRDLTREANQSKNELLMMIRDQECDLKFANGILA